jgi:hypothetical protein
MTGGGEARAWEPYYTPEEEWAARTGKFRKRPAVHQAKMDWSVWDS